MSNNFTIEDRALAQEFPAEPLLRDALTTYHERRAQYGASEQLFADVMTQLFPEGITLRTHDDHVRYGLFTQMVSKLCRYAKDFRHGHIDSVHDLGVYSFMLEAEDRRVQQQPPFKFP